MSERDRPTPVDADPAHSQEHMLGHGYYNKHSHEQEAANQFGLAHIEQAIAALDLDPGPRHLRIADYGSAQGHNSLLPMKTAVQAIKARWNPAPSISVIHTDLPTNDWTTLFQTVLTHQGSYLAGQEEVYCLASGTSVFQEIFPADYIALGYTAIVEHWLSKKPGCLPDHVWSTRAQGQSQAVWASQAWADWRAFLTHRAKELIPGGRLVMVGSGADPDGNSGAEPLVDLANRVLQDMVAQGVLSTGEYDDMAIPTYYRNEAEWRQPFEDQQFLAQAPLIMRHYEEFAMADYHQDAFAQSGDAARFARDCAGFFKAAFEPVLFVGLEQTRDQEGKERVIQDFSQRLTAALEKDPAKYPARWWIALMVIEKVSV